MLHRSICMYVCYMQQRKILDLRLLNTEISLSYVISDRDEKRCYFFLSFNFLEFNIYFQLSDNINPLRWQLAFADRNE